MTRLKNIPKKSLRKMSNTQLRDRMRTIHNDMLRNQDRWHNNIVNRQGYLKELKKLSVLKDKILDVSLER